MVNEAGLTSESRSPDQPAGLAIVTGAAKRLGKAIALTLAGEHRYDIVVHYGRSQTEAEDVVTQIQSFGRQAIAVSADLMKPQQAADAIFSAAENIGPVTALINCAAVFEDQSIGNITAEHCQKQFFINTFAPLLLAQKLSQQLPKHAHGLVINLLDWRATRPPSSYLAYTASKAALASLTKGLSQQLAPKIRVNAIAPGAMLPPKDSGDWHEERAAASIPLKRTGSPDDICRAVSYLMQSTFVTGEIMYVTGGEEL